MHPRGGPVPWSAARGRHVRALLDFVRTHGAVHPREVDAHFSHGTVANYWGGSSSATTHLLDAMHYRGLLRVARREAGIRIYAVHEHAPGPRDAATRAAHLDALVDVVVGKYAPLPASSLSMLVRRLRYAVPQWRGELGKTLQRAKRRLAHARVDGVDWYWPSSEDPAAAAVDDQVRLLAPFDPVVWDRRRFEMLWGWAYRFEAYTPVPKRKLGYYALPLLWRDRVIGWANVSVKDGDAPPRTRLRRVSPATRPRVSGVRSTRNSPACGGSSASRPNCNNTPPIAKPAAVRSLREKPRTQQLREHALGRDEIETEKGRRLTRGKPEVRSRLELFADPLHEFSKVLHFHVGSGDAGLHCMNGRNEHADRRRCIDLGH